MQLTTGHPSLIAIVLVLAMVGCEAPPDTPPTPQAQMEDSAGIRIVENPRPEAGSRLGWQVSAGPTITIGTVGGGEQP